MHCVYANATVTVRKPLIWASLRLQHLLRRERGGSGGSRESGDCNGIGRKPVNVAWGGGGEFRAAAPPPAWDSHIHLRLMAAAILRIGVPLLRDKLTEDEMAHQFCNVFQSRLCKAVAFVTGCWEFPMLGCLFSFASASLSTASS